MSKKMMLLALALILVLTAATACSKSGNESGSSETGGEGAASSGPVKRLQLMTLQAESVDTLNAYAESFSQKNPGYAVDVTVIPGVAEFNAAMAAKLAAGDPPDLMIYQWGTQIQLYAKGGNLLDLSDSGLGERFKPIPKNINVYKGKTYAYPISQAIFGMYFNTDVAAKYGVTEYPKTFEQFLAACETLRKNGLEAPVVIPGKDGSGATAFNFGYLHLIVAGQNPDFYRETVEGTRHWNGPEFEGLFNAYSQVLNYANKDLLGLDPDGARRRFVKEEAVFYMGGTAESVALRQLNPDLNFMIIPDPFLSDESDYKTIADFDTGISISSKTKYPEAALAFLDEMFTVESGELFAKNMSTISAVKDTQVSGDPILENQMPLLNSGKYVGFSEREWIPGIKELMKKATQQWMGGTDIRTTLDSLEAEHQRLLKASPDFKTDYLEQFNSQ